MSQSTVIIMILGCGIIWGGLVSAIYVALKKKKRKKDKKFY